MGRQAEYQREVQQRVRNADMDVKVLPSPSTGVRDRLGALEGVVGKMVEVVSSLEKSIGSLGGRLKRSREGWGRSLGGAALSCKRGYCSLIRR